ncbi:MAG: hypothetical protein OXU74_09680 [Gemmatimonadota bacterium]|nr:hypothetical protein [Gemmatimonadota bacterium]
MAGSNSGVVAASLLTGAATCDCVAVGRKTTVRLRRARDVPPAEPVVLLV